MLCCVHVILAFYCVMKGLIYNSFCAGRLLTINTHGLPLKKWRKETPTWTHTNVPRWIVLLQNATYLHWKKGKTSTSFSVHMSNRIKWHCKTGDLILSLSRYQTGFCFVTVNVKSSALKVRQFVHSCLRLQREFYFSVVTMFLNG